MLLKMVQKPHNETMKSAYSNLWKLTSRGRSESNTTLPFSGGPREQTFTMARKDPRIDAPWLFCCLLHMATLRKLNPSPFRDSFQTWFGRSGYTNLTPVHFCTFSLIEPRQMSRYSNGISVQRQDGKIQRQLFLVLACSLTVLVSVIFLWKMKMLIFSRKFK